jgi:DMSO/TMAO reductase YedYZ molybdopterin-dependent catalytic subunit
VFRSRAERKVEKAGYDPARLPPGQYLTEKWPVLHAGTQAEQGFTANVPLAAIEDEHALIAYEADGEPLTPEHGWPLRLVVPSKYFWKSAKWLRGLQLLDHDQPGFWERYGYHNEADYWKEERYEF